MRKRTFLSGALALVVVAAVPAVASAAVSSQTIKGAASPAKASTSPKLAKPVALRVDTDTNYSTFEPFPSSYASSVNVDFDNDFTFNTKGIPTCDPTKLPNTTTEAAIAACGQSKVGTGSATVRGNALFGSANGVVTAFNGAPQGANPVLLLHARIGPPLNTTSVLTGVLTPSPLHGDYGKRLVVTVPPLAGGQVVITHFDTTVQRPVTVKKKVKGKTKKVKSGYVTAVCRDKDKLWNYSGEFNFTANPTAQPSITTTATQPCKPIPVKKKK
jgi:hypothetical protein